MGLTAAHPITDKAAAGITKVAADAATLGSGAKVRAHAAVGVSEGSECRVEREAFLASRAETSSQRAHHKRHLALAQRPLTVLITNLTHQIIQPLLAPEFHPSVPLVLNATHMHALAYAKPRVGGGQSSNDGLKPLKEGLVNGVSKVVGPFVLAIKTEVSAVIAELEKEPASPPAVPSHHDRLSRAFALCGSTVTGPSLE
ncbi:hypothetical protein FRC01_008569 [Tulasnella sp. 417]|nr:hypothetical protein FRC01_008569 [Tulasnella sp. 417]